MRWTSLAFVSIVLVMLAAMTLLAPLRSLGHDATPAPVSCGVASPITRSGAAPGTATPMVPETDAALVGTPVVTSCLRVILQADSTDAGPVTLTVAVVDLTGAPVSDAQVTIESRHTTMDHSRSCTRWIWSATSERGCGVAISRTRTLRGCPTVWLHRGAKRAGPSETEWERETGHGSSSLYCHSGTGGWEGLYVYPNWSVFHDRNCLDSSTIAGPSLP